MIRSGQHGEAVDKAEIRQLVIDMLRQGRGEVIRPGVIITEPTRFDTARVYESIVCDPQDAYYTMENDNLVLVPHRVGRQIDRAELEKIIGEINNTENIRRRLPVTYVIPEITSERQSPCSSGTNSPGTARLSRPGHRLRKTGCTT